MKGERKYHCQSFQCPRRISNFRGNVLPPNDINHVINENIIGTTANDYYHAVTR